MPLIRKIRMLRDKRIDHTHHVPVGDDVHAAVGIVHAVHQLAAVVNEKLLGVAVAVGIGHVVHGENKRGLAFGQHDLLPHHFPVLFDPELVQIVQHVAALVELGQYLFKFGLFGEAGVVAAHRRCEIGEDHFRVDYQTVQKDMRDVVGIVHQRGLLVLKLRAGGGDFIALQLRIGQRGDGLVIKILLRESLRA